MLQIFVTLTFLSRSLRVTTDVIVDRTLCDSVSNLGWALIRVPVQTVGYTTALSVTLEEMMTVRFDCSEEKATCRQEEVSVNRTGQAVQCIH
jgi:hypothetical protein